MISSRRRATTALFAVIAIASWMVSGIFIVKDDNEDYSEGYTGLVGEYAPIENLKNGAAEGRIRLFVYQTLIERGLAPIDINCSVQFTTLNYMRTTGSILKSKDNTYPLVFGGMANLSTADGGYATVFIDHKGSGMVITHVRGTSPEAPANNNNENKESNENINENKDNNKDNESKLRVVSYNIWNYNGNWNKRIKLLCDEICSPTYDAVALQELRYESWAGEAGMGRLQIEHLVSECRRRGVDLNYVWQPAMMYHQHIQNNGEYEVEGVGILTRHPIVGIDRKFLARSAWDSQDEHQRVALAARIRPGPAGSSAERDFTFISTHFSLSDTMETSNAHEMAEFAEALAAEKWPGPAVVMGDFNAEPSSDAYAYITGEAGFTDAWTAAARRNGPENGFSWARVPGDPTTKRVDYCFYKNFGGDAGVATVEVAPAVATIPEEFHCVENGEDEDDEEYDEEVQVESSQPSRTCASDHLPLSVEFTITPKTSSDDVNVEVEDVSVKEEL